MRSLLYPLLFLISFSAQSQSLTTGLIAYYPFSGNANDESGKKNHGLVQRAQLTTDRFGKPNSAYRFSDGARIQVPNSPSLKLANSYTVSVWVNLHSFEGRDGYKGTLANNGGHVIYAKDCDKDGLVAILTVQHKPRVFVGQGIGKRDLGSGLIYFCNWQLKRWYHTVFVGNGKELFLYIDGLLIAKSTGHYQPSAANKRDLLIGAMNCWPYFFNGDLDDFRFYNRALSETEVADLYDTEKPTSPSAPTTRQVR